MNLTGYVVARFGLDTGVPVFRAVNVLSEFPCEQLGAELQVCLYRFASTSFQQATEDAYEWALSVRGTMDPCCWVYDKLPPLRRAR